MVTGAIVSGLVVRQSIIKEVCGGGELIISWGLGSTERQVGVGMKSLFTACLSALFPSVEPTYTKSMNEARAFRTQSFP